jgi:DNA-binding NtrC family response regulator
MPRILIVEREVELRPALEFVLKPFGLSTVWVPDSAAALKALENPRDLGLVMADYACAGIDLLKTCQREAPDLPFILMSASPDSVFEEMIRKGLECPEFLLKPYTAKDCRDVVSRLLKTPADAKAA